MLVEQTPIPDAALPVEALRQHLRLGSGFATDELQDGLLASFLRAALSAIEARTGKALIRRGFSMTLSQWRGTDAQSLPVAPVVQVDQLVLRDGDGAEVIVAPDRYRLDPHGTDPKLRARGVALPQIPVGGAAVVALQAGYGGDFTDLPADLQQAVMLLAAHYYEYRDATALSEGCMPFGVTSLIARYRPVRLGMGS
jgi:uncharacterized phiE125 gp8 family phage protein